MPDPRKHPIEREIPTAAIAQALSNVVLAANPVRLGADITNVSDPSETISLALGQAAVLGAGKTLTARGSVYHMGTDNLYSGDIYGISASGTAALSVSEES
ncbi:unnamed protein product [marine sediment metagenome]|uniref:Uncharacterized protein n=1 Tax=marine sediment metagenome TaxID=412755 RepID=X1C5B3_9ZZZZ